MINGKVYLVGAGCGDADLITVRGQKLIAACEVLIYDDLIAPALLQMAKCAEQIYVGKRSGKHSMPQSEINDLLVRKALDGRFVVRLKGGDPFVFGRGGEEIEALKAAGVAYEVVPGITSSIAIPAAAGIPVSHRGLSQSFHVITGHTADTEDGLPNYMEKLAALPGTLIFLMGLSRLENISTRLMAGGLSGETPAAVISGGNSPNPATVRAPLSQIASKAAENNVKSPAIIVVGKTAALDYSSTLPLPLKGVNIALTGTDSMTEKISPMLRNLGAQVYLAQRSIIHETLPEDALSHMMQNPGCVVFTSSNGVRCFFRQLLNRKIDLRQLHCFRFAVIGAATGSLLSSYGIHADFCPAEYTTEALSALLLDALPQGERVYLFRSALGSPQLFSSLQTRLDVRDIHAYTIRSDSDVREAAKARLANTDYILFSSAAGVEQFLSDHGKIPSGVRYLCIGHVTGKALTAHGYTNYLQAEHISAEGMVETLLRCHE